MALAVTSEVLSDLVIATIFERESRNIKAVELASGMQPFDPSPQLLRDSNRVCNRALPTDRQETINQMILCHKLTFKQVHSVDDFEIVFPSFEPSRSLKLFKQVHP